jgi:hypothetical protein|mmetsp:Transcript_34937/g.58489  ORF Transcript_34937/g.58489 Transcript_34937/m.58489 type:complete len:93 (+) Transcript_34937:610-888(+)
MYVVVLVLSSLHDTLHSSSHHHPIFQVKVEFGMDTCLLCHKWKSSKQAPQGKLKNRRTLMGWHCGMSAGVFLLLAMPVDYPHPSPSVSGEER